MQGSRSACIMIRTDIEQTIFVILDKEIYNCLYLTFLLYGTVDMKHFK